MNCYFPYDEPRPQQEIAMDFINDTFIKQNKKFCIVEAGTGVGKSGLGIFAANLLDKKGTDRQNASYFLTTQKILQEQYEKDFSSSQNLKNLMSSTNYSCKYYKGASCSESLRLLKLEPLRDLILFRGLKKISNLYLKYNQQGTNFQI